MKHTPMPASAPTARGWRVLLLGWCALLLGPARDATAQCTSQWQPGFGYPGVNGFVGAMIPWDPDGAGPAPRVLVIGGRFTIAGNVAASQIALHDPVSGTWTPLGAGIQPNAPAWDQSVSALAVLSNGELVAAGTFTAAGNAAASNIARWNGSSWSALGAGTNGPVYALAVQSNGDLLVGGQYTTAGGVPAANIARWNGGGWSAVGGGLAGLVWAIEGLPNGDTVAGGLFPGRVSRWNGSSWSVLGSPPVNGFSLAVMPNGDVVAAGPGLARWNGTTWSTFPGTAGWQFVNRVLVLSNQDLLAGGYLSSGALVARWNGITWLPLPGFTSHVSSLVEPLPEVLFAGGEQTVSAGGASGLARWNGIGWVPAIGGSNGAARALTLLNDGSLVAGGVFTALGGASANLVARRVGTTWSGLGNGAFGPVRALAAAPNGDLFAGGYENNSQSRAFVQRWNGSSWSTPWFGTACYPEGCAGVVSALATRLDGVLVVGGRFQQFAGVPAAGLVRWDGTTWAAVAPGLDCYTAALLRASNGDIVVGGLITLVGGWSSHMVARWDGSSLSRFGSGGYSEYVIALAERPNGDLVAAGEFRTIDGVAANRIATWNGSSWSPLGAGLDAQVESLLVLPNGDVIAGGQFTNAGGVPANRVARWNGSSWSAIDGGMDDAVTCLAFLPTGEVVAGGHFTTSGTAVSCHVARLLPNCWAAATAYGAGCTGAAGTVSLTAMQLPWIGADFVGRVQGVPATALAIHLIGFSQVSVPLSVVLPTALPGCTILMAPAWIDTLSGSNGTAVARVTVPNDVTLVGQSFFDQAVVLEMAGGTIQAATSSNALRLTIGVF